MPWGRVCYPRPMTQTASDKALARVADRMADAAHGLLAALDNDQRARVGWTWSQGSESERRRWFYTPTDHGGLPIGEMSPTQYRRTMALVGTGLSSAGYTTVAAVMGLENVLDHAEGFAGLDFGRERGRDPGMYYVRVFGSPGDPVWGWRFGGHHVSLNNLVVDGVLVATTPCFLGADPASSPLLGDRVLRPLGGMEDLARELVRSLGDELRAKAILSPRPPVDIVGANRTRVAPGDRVIPLPEVWRERFTGALDEKLLAVHEGAERHYGITPSDHAAVELSSEPKGVAGRELDSSQRELLRAVLSCYTGRAPDPIASAAADRYSGDRLDEVYIAWAGSTEPGEGHYYRLQGPRLLVEYDNTQRNVNHAHSVWRDPDGDFGLDVLDAHLAAHHG